jgi:glycosyltransferase involved in cell wall biosynthesis
MVPSAKAELMEISRPSRPLVAVESRPLEGKRAAMVTFSPYPFDPRPRRAIEAIVSEGMTVDLICLGSDKSPKREIVNGVNVLRIPVNKEERGGKLKYGYRYASFILISSLIFAWRSLRRRYDLVWVHNMPDILVLCSLIPQALGAKVILDMHDPMPELMMTIFNAKRESRSVRVLRRIEKWSLGRANLVLTVNIACKRMFASRSCSAEKIGIVMNSPDERIFPFHTPRPRISARAEGDRFVVMYHGSLVERNGLDLAVEALARVRETIPNAELRIYGHATPFLERIMELGRKKNVNIRYLGPKRLEDLVLEIEGCDVGVIPNHRNVFTEINTPTRIFEYLALGKPVIAPRTPGIQDYFSPESLLFFEPGDPEELARKVEYVFSHPREAIEVAERGQQVYLAHTWSQERQSLVNRVSGLLNGEKLQ